MTGLLLFFFFTGNAQEKKGEATTTVSTFQLKAANLEELSDINWQDIRDIFKENSPEAPITLAFVVSTNMKQADAQNFRFKITGKTSELDQMIIASQKVLREMESLEKDKN